MTIVLDKFQKKNQITQHKENKKINKIPIEYLLVLIILHFSKK
jgi:hypothetical protein